MSTDVMTLKSENVAELLDAIKERKVISANLNKERWVEAEYEMYTEASSRGHFLQSVHWEKVKKDWICERIQVRDSVGNITASAQILIKKIPMFNLSFMYAPRGPVCDYHDMESLRKLMRQIKRIQKKHHGFTLKIDPAIEEEDKLAISNLKKLGFKYDGSRDDYDTVQCRSNYILEFDGRTEDEIFASFHNKWRYNIRLAQRKGVSCDYYGIDKIDDFYELMLETGERDGFQVREKEYYVNLLASMEKHARLYLCYYEGKAIAGAIAINYGERVSYVYGASTAKYRNVMPNYLMQWTMIKWAIDTCCKVYDFMGIPFYYDESHPNYGVYRFKKGFSGRVINYAGEFNYTYYPVVTKIIIKFLNKIGYKL